MNVAEQSLGELARDIPGVTAIFHKYKLDFCCGGAQSLKSAAEKRSLDVKDIELEIDALKKLDSSEEKQSDLSDEALVEHILRRYHDIHRQQLVELIRLATRVEKVHQDHPACPLGLTSHLVQMQEELETHMQKEEQILFPLILNGQKAIAVAPTTMMRYEHDDHGLLLQTLDHLTNDITLPANACNTWNALYTGLASFKNDLMNHIHLENNILFARVDNC